jgi:hypothetical protein
MWAGLAPAYGMIGTLIGLIQMLKNLADQAKLGPSMAVALITSFYGSVMSNFLFNPIASKTFPGLYWFGKKYGGAEAAPEAGDPHTGH